MLIIRFACSCLYLYLFSNFMTFRSFFICRTEKKRNKEYNCVCGVNILLVKASFTIQRRCWSLSTQMGDGEGIFLCNCLLIVDHWPCIMYVCTHWDLTKVSFNNQNILLLRYISNLFLPFLHWNFKNSTTLHYCIDIK